MIIRDAKPADIEGVVRLCHMALAATPYSHLPMDDMALRRAMLYHITAPSQFAQVVEVDGQLEGLLVCQVEKVWHSTKKHASDLVYFCTEKGQGGGAIMMRRFLRWAKKQNGVRVIQISVTNGGPKIKRTGRMLEKMGMTFAGGNYLEKVDG
jgi:L-amino acid N-acyltransferase YncA